MRRLGGGVDVGCALRCRKRVKLAPVMAWRSFRDGAETSAVAGGARACGRDGIGGGTGGDIGARARSGTGGGATVDSPREGTGDGRCCGSGAEEGGRGGGGVRNGLVRGGMAG